MTEPGQERPARSWARFEPLLWILAAGIPAAAFWARLRAHVGYLHDHESLLIPTAGRELLHGHIRQLTHYRYNLYQGSNVVDELLSAAGFAMFGDSILAWKWWGLAYAVGIAILGTTVLRRTTSRVGALAFLLLLATAPFVVKDGLLTPAGAHSSGFFYALVPIAIAVSGKGRPGFRRGLAAGLAIAFATWYMRSAIAAGPAVAVALLPGGRRALAGMTLGVLGFPLLCLVDTALLTMTGGPLAHRGFGIIFPEMLGAIRADHLTPDYPGKTLEAIGAAARPYLFAQPDLPPGVTSPPYRPTFRWAADVWFIGWMVGTAALVGLAALRGPEGAQRRPLWGASVVLALAGAYAATYVVSPFRIDGGLFASAMDAPQVAAPGLSGPRYLVPVFLGWTMALAGAAGLAWTNRWTRVLLVGVGYVVFAGWMALSLDLRDFAEPPERWSELRPFDYHRVWGLGRGPPLERHVRCAYPDPISRGNHLRVAGWHYAADPLTMTRQKDYVARRIREFQEAWFTMAPVDLAFFVQGSGQAMGDAMQTTHDLPFRRLFAAAFENGETLGPELGSVFLRGFAGTIAWDVVNGEPLPTAELLCDQTSWGMRPFCPLIGKLFATPNIAQAGGPSELFDSRFPAELLAGPLGPDIVRGAGEHLRRVAPWLRLVTRTEWPPHLLAAFERGWAEEDARLRWRTGDKVTPELLP